MQTIVKIPQKIFERARSDLMRPHPFAFERVGFFSTRCTRTKSVILVHCFDYHPVSESHYIADETVGARIGPNAITEAMSRSINDSAGQVHVHLHGGSGLPYPSGTDGRELPGIAQSVRNANRKEAHGWMILGNRNAWASLILPDELGVVSQCPVTIVGFPTITNPGNVSTGRKVRSAKNERYTRQSFLGADSEKIIGQIVVGVIGLGGGGSHVVQQLAYLGFKNFVLCDYDRISKSNLNRLVGGTLADVRAKRLKTAIATRSIKKLHKNAVVVARAKKWEDAVEDLLPCDLIVGCVDGYGARRDLEGFCRRNLIPYLDVGMDVHQLPKGDFEIYGQAILSMPAYPCMHCMGFLNEQVLGEEAQRYGDAGDRPQVVWSNGLLCSAIVGVAVGLFTDWSKTLRGPVYLGFRGSNISLGTDNRVPLLRGHQCRHFPFGQLGDPVLTPL